MYSAQSAQLTAHSAQYIECTMPSSLELILNPNPVQPFEKPLCSAADKLTLPPILGSAPAALLKPQSQSLSQALSQCYSINQTR